MFHKKMLALPILITLFLALTTAINGSGELGLISYNGQPTNINFSGATIKNANEESVEVSEKLEEFEKSIQNINIGESVWMIVVPFMPKGAYYGEQGAQFSFGSCVAISPEDPAFKMDEYDRDQMKNYGIAKKNYDKDSTYVDTNFHVVDTWDEKDNLPIEIKKIFITPEGKRKIISYEAKLIGTAPREDLAVLKIEGVKIPTLQMGDMTKISDYQKRWGYPAIAFGAPYIFEGTPSNGKAFYPSRDLNNVFAQYFGATIDTPLNGERYQINALIHPGNSGGLLAGAQSENKDKIIGKPCSGYPGSSVNFAIPDFVLKEIIPQIITGKVRYPYYSGLITANPNTALKDPLNIAFFKKLGFKSIYYEIMENEKGALVVGFMDDSPFKSKSRSIINPFAKKPTQAQQDEKDIRYGDVITEVNDQPVEGPHDFLNKLRAIKDPEINIKVTRFTEVMDQETGLKVWKKQEIVIKKTKEELTINEQGYKNLYQSIRMNGFSAMMSAGEIRGERIPFKTELVFK